MIFVFMRLSGGAMMFRKVAFAVLAFLVIGLISGVFTVSAVFAAADAAAPGDMLYGIDRGMEAILLGLTISEEGQAELQAANALERLEEIRQLIESGDQVALDETMQNYGKPSDDTDALTAENAAAPGDDPIGDGNGAYCNGSKEQHHPNGDKLAENHNAEYEEIMGWFCVGYGFGEIDLAYEIAEYAGNAVTEIFEMRAGGAGWGEIMLTYDFKDTSLDDNGDEDNGDEDNGDEDNGDEDNGDEDNGDEDNVVNEGAYCSGLKGKDHPKGYKLSERYGVGYDEIMDWFCQGYGFGEIDLAYAIGEFAEVDVDEIFGQRADGVGWGVIKQENGLIGKDKAPKDNGPKDKGAKEKGPKDKPPKDKDKDKKK
jgi:hypothetical protein